MKTERLTTAGDGDPAGDQDVSEDPRIAAAEYEREHPMDDPGEADHAALREFGP